MSLVLDLNKIKKYMVFALLFLAAMNFNAKFFYFALASIVLLFVIQKDLIVVPASFPYLLLGVVMAIYNSDEGILSMIRCSTYVALYLVGYNLIFGVTSKSGVIFDNDNSIIEKTGYYLITTISMGSFLHYVLNFLFNRNDFENRNTVDIWSREPMAATGQAVLAYLMLGFSISLIFSAKKKKHKFIGILCIAGMLAYNFIIAVRTMIAVLVILVILGIFYNAKLKNNVSQTVKVVIGVFAAIMILVACFSLNVWGVRDFIFDSNLFNRFDDFSIKSFVVDTNRSNAKLAYVINMFEYPFGGLHLRDQYGYAHDLLLDGYDEYGIFGALLLLIILISGIIELYKLIMYTKYRPEIKFTFFSVYITILLVFCVEPILAGMAWLFACYSLLNGCIKAMNHYYNKNFGETNEGIANKHCIRRR